MTSLRTIPSLLLLIVLAVTGCVHFPATNRGITVKQNVAAKDILEAAVDTAREVNFPPMTKMDVANGLVEFGAFGTPILGTTAQVRMRSSTQVDITVSRGSAYIKMGVDEQADQFTKKLEARIANLK